MLLTNGYSWASIDHGTNFFKYKYLVKSIIKKMYT